jgi:biopolymer transport protein ExbD
MRHRRTWISRHREDQKDITCLFIYMVILFAFHYAMRLLTIFAICTLKEPPTRLTLQNHNFPYEVIDGFILISCLILVCSAFHLVGSLRRRLAIKLIAISLVVSSCCLIANSTILRSILKSSSTHSIPKLDPTTLIFDVDKRGWLSLHNCSLSLTTINRLLESRFERFPPAPIIICADKRSHYRNVRELVDSCHTVGAMNISLARQEGFDRYAAPIFNEKSIPSNIPTNMVTCVEVGRRGVVLNGTPVSRRDMASVMSDYVKQRTGHWYSMKVTEDATCEYVLILLHSFQTHDVTNLVWDSFQ